jgi:hypothetical protein
MTSPGGGPRIKDDEPAALLLLLKPRRRVLLRSFPFSSLEDLRQSVGAVVPGRRAFQEFLQNGPRYVEFVDGGPEPE